ncbi:hypothetical protein [Streptomyces siamensis]|uniref:Uncharacterized protein n=1 Tax=Streptomyces siamensis TaxID=1274986 RepID=A0ABP9JIY7_9ACTN
MGACGRRVPAAVGPHVAPVLAALELPGGTRTFLDKAVRTANEEFTGTLGANLVAHPRSRAPLPHWDPHWTTSGAFDTVTVANPVSSLGGG